MRVVNVPLNDRSYRILIGPGLLPRLGKECLKLGLGRRCAIVTDERIPARSVKTAESALRASGFEPITIKFPSGEATKRLSNIERCHNQLAAHRLERKSFIVALGGGVIGDLAGFAAASYLRGIDFVQVPTTLLAQVDSSVGGKTGVNLKAGKNLVGAFHQPRLVLCDLDMLKTLPRRELRAGMAEVIKYGVIHDARLFRQLERDMPRLLKLDADKMAAVVARCCQIKADVVAEDEREGGLRAILNFGHTIGHAIEAISGYGEYLHGEAISIGQIAAARISSDIHGLPAADVRRIHDLFAAAKLPTVIALNPRQMTRLMSAMQLDKKVSGGEVKFVLASKIGRVDFGKSVPADLVTASLNALSRDRGDQPTTAN